MPPSTRLKAASASLSQTPITQAASPQPGLAPPKPLKRSTKAAPRDIAPKRGQAAPDAPAQDGDLANDELLQIPVKRRKTTKAPAPPNPPIHQTPNTPPRPFSLTEAQAHLSTQDPRFRRIFAHLPCKPFEPPYPIIDPFRTLVTSIVGQQVSWMAARAINKRFRALFGFVDANEEGEGGGFPTPAMVAGEDVLVLKSAGLSLRKAEYVKSLAEHFVSGQLTDELLREGSDEEVAKALIAVRGIGQWTVDMFLMFSLRRPDVLPVGDLGVQKGLIRWVLAAHDALPTSTKAKGKASEQARDKYGLGKKVIQDKVDEHGQGEIDTLVKPMPRPVTPTRDNPQLPPTPFTPNDKTPAVATLHTPDTAGSSTLNRLPPTPLSPGIKPSQTLVVGQRELPPPAPEELLASLPDDPSWDANRIAPLEEGLSVELLKSRLSGKKAKGGAYLTPREMEVLTEGWRPFRSLGVYYMWPAGEEF